MRRPTAGEVLSLAPDDAGRRAASALAHSGPWSDAGADDRAVWGRCRGTSRSPYDVACDLADFSYRCSCPSQKQPCKHVVALLVLWAGGSPVVTPGPPPADVAAWLATRPLGPEAVSLADRVIGQRVDPHAATAPPTPPAVARRPADPDAAAARAAQRAERIAAGMAELDLWLGDLLRAGVASAATQPYRYWDDMAARLVDAQAPGTAAAVRDLAGLPHSGEGWPGRLLAAVARLHLLAAGWARYGALPAETRADLRAAAGWPWPADEILAGPKERDRWYVLARVATDDPQLRVQRTWLWGLRSGRPALIVDFARPGAAFAWQLWPGECMEASVARYPGSAPLRVLVAEQHEHPEPGGAPPGWEDLAALATARGRARATDPWSERWPVSVREVVPEVRPEEWWAARVGVGREAQCAAGPGLGPESGGGRWMGPEGGGGRWVLRDRNGSTVGLAGPEESRWKLAALSGGHPLQVLGEWSAEAVTPLGAWVEDRMVVL